ncbi:MAG: hypothetical protein LUC20_09315, partial [Oscillospiraceae bacterium]|nr:hypothetical protein [Oscillospiraceae bacterium]
MKLFNLDDKRSRLLLFGGATAVLVIIIVVICILIGSLTGSSKKYSEYYENAQLAYLTKDYDGALGWLEQALGEKSTAECYSLMADIYLAQDDLDMAIQVL